MARRNLDIELSHGTQIRDFVWIEDLCNLIYSLIKEESLPFCINVGTGRGVSVKQAVLAYSRFLNIDEKRLIFGALPRNPHDADRIVADVTRLGEADLPTPPQRLLSETLSEEVFKKINEAYS